MKKAIIGVLVVICLAVFAMTGCSSGDKQNPKYTYGELSGSQTVESVFNLAGETTSLPDIMDFTNFGAASGERVTNQYSATSDGGIVVWGSNGKYIYSPDAADLEELKTEFIRIATRDFTKKK